ncbi:MAG: hydrogenase iron-sulfur subunit [Promethearchaeota archaeon]
MRRRMRRSKVALFLCTCGRTLSKTIDFEQLVNFSSELEDVEVVRVHDTLCLDKGLDFFTKTLKDEKIGAAVIAACSPQIYEERFLKAIHKSKLGTLIDFANIREQSAWVHSSTPQKATNKAKVMIASSIEKVKGMKEEKAEKRKVNKSALIVGGGIAGLNAALDIAGQGFNVIIVEKTSSIGGLSRLFEETEIRDLVSQSMDDVKKNRRIRIFSNSLVKDVKGVPGAYDVVIAGTSESEKEPVELQVGAILLATGLREYDPSSIPKLKYGKHKNIITGLQVSQMMHPDGATGGKIIVPSTKKKPKRVMFIQCVGSRDSRHKWYCSSICCNYALKHANRLNELGIETFVNYVDIRTPYLDEKRYIDALKKGTIFLKGEVKGIRENADELTVSIDDTLTGDKLDINCDMVVLNPALVPTEEAETLSRLLGIGLDSAGFYQTVYPKVITAESKSRGLFICGSAFSPMDIQQTLVHAHAAALEAVEFLRRSTIEPRKTIPELDEELCDACRACESMCGFNAVKVEAVEAGREVAKLRLENCVGCGVCAAVCPTKAIQLRNYDQETLFAQIETVVKTASDIDASEPVILGLYCNECAYCSADMAGRLHKEYSSNIYPITVPCAGRISVLEILKALTEGADGVFIAACPSKSCHYPPATDSARLMIDFTKEILDALGVDERRVEIFNMVSYDPIKFAESANLMAERVTKLGPNPVKNATE